MKLALGCPVVGAVPGEAYHSHLALLAYLGKSHEVLVPAVCDLFPHATARNMIMKTALDRGASHLLFLDSDMLIPDPRMVDELERVMNETEAAMTAGHAYRRGWPFTPTWFKIVEDQIYQCTAPPNGLPAQIDGCGLPFNLVNLEWVRAHLTEPYFFQGEKDGKKIMEDLFFSKAICEAGGKIIAVPTARVGHLGPRICIDDSTVEQCQKWFAQLHPEIAEKHKLEPLSPQPIY